MFLRSISNYRGIAIIAIVAGHMYGYGFSSNDAITSMISNVITGGTALFVFISGFMFHYLFYKRYDYKKFMKNKILNVGVPYFILASCAIFLLFITSKGYFNPINLMENADNAYQNGNLFSPSDSSFMVAVKYYATGRFLTAYWYIPFALILFATAPLHIKFIRLSVNVKVLIVLLLSLIAVFVHRPVAGTNPLHSLVFYTPVYLMGILISMYSLEVKRALKGKGLALLIGVIVLSVIEYLTGHQGNYAKPFFEYNGIDIMFLQKIFLILYIYNFVESYDFNFKVLNVISDTSFAIFFMHPWVMILVSKLYKVTGLLPEEGSNNIIIYIFSTALVLLISVSIALLGKKVFSGSKNTRYLIGY